MGGRYDFKNKNVLVIGLGISGMGAAKLLKRLGANVIVNDMAVLDRNDEQLLELESLGISYIGGLHDIAILHEIDYAVKNPGIPYYNDFIQAIIQRDIPLITEPEIAMQVCKGKVIAITGTNGKTTTTMMIYAMLKKAFEEVYIAGNIGISFAEVAMIASESSYVVLELSSFQLMGMPFSAPDVAVLLNITEAHLDYHTNYEEYIQAKLHIFSNMKDGLIILNADDSTVANASVPKDFKGTTEYFSIKKYIEGTFVADDGFIYHQGEQVCHVQEMNVPGSHNTQNVLAAIDAVKFYGVSNSKIVAALNEFSGVEHRLEYVRTIKGRKFYNDSKSTNVKSAQIALSAFQQPIIWIAGGLDRGNDLSEIIPYCEQVKVIIGIGESQDKFIELAEKMKISSFKAMSMQEAVQAAMDFSDIDDVILLSPASASWDQYKNFEERGTDFKKCVQYLD